MVASGPRHAMGRPRGWPRSLGGRTALVLVLVLTLMQAASLTIHALDRIEAMRLAQMREVASRAISLYRTISFATPDVRAGVARELVVPDGVAVALENGPPTGMLPATAELDRLLQLGMQLVPIPQLDRPQTTVLLGGVETGQVVIGMAMPAGQWVNVTMNLPPVRWWLSSSLLIAFTAMTAAAVALTLWVVRRLTAPVKILAAAAERLGQDVNAPPLPEDG